MMVESDIAINTAAYFPLNLLGSNAVYRATGMMDLELMPAKFDRVAPLRAPESAIKSGHESWRSDKNPLQLVESLQKAGISLKAGLALLSYGLMPVGCDMSDYLLTTKPVVVYPNEISAAKRQGFGQVSIQPTPEYFGVCGSEFTWKLERFARLHPDIGITLDTQHTPSPMWEHICEYYPERIREIHARVGVDVPGWAHHLDQYINADDQADSPLTLISITPKVPVVSEITVIAAKARYPKVNYRKTFEAVYGNIRSAMRLQKALA